MTLELRPMGAARRAHYVGTSKEGYIAELIRAGMRADLARENADRTMRESFDDGQPINGNELFDLVLDGAPVGILWIGPQAPTDWWVMDIEVEPGFRRRGVGRDAMRLAEQRARELGATQLSLSVFGHNPNARSLYESLGFEIQSIRMRKQL